MRSLLHKLNIRECLGINTQTVIALYYRYGLATIAVLIKR